MPTQIHHKRNVAGLIEYKAQLLYTELIDASTTQTLDLITLPAGAVVHQVWGDNVTAATDAGSISALGIEVGSSGDPNSFLTTYDVFGSTGRWHVPGVWEDGNSLAVKVKATATGANLGDGTNTDLDTGEVHITILYSVSA